MRAISRLLVAMVVVGTCSTLGVAASGARETQTPTPEVAVLEAGSAPREALRFAPAVGAPEGMRMTLRFGVDQSGVSDASLNTPPLRATIAATLQDITPTGDLHASFSYPAFEVLKGNGATARQRRAVEQALAGLGALSGDLTVTTRGALIDSNVELPPDLDPSVAQLIGQLSDQFRDITVPLPEQEVGVGGRWRATTQLDVSGIDVRQVYDYRLEKRTGSTLELDVRGTQTAKPQTVESPGGVTLQVERYKTTFRGSTTLDLTRLLPVASRITGRGNQTFDVRAGGESGELSQRLDIRVTVTRE
jgi:hypothetical protein